MYQVKLLTTFSNKEQQVLPNAGADYVKKLHAIDATNLHQFKNSSWVASCVIAP